MMTNPQHQRLITGNIYRIRSRNLPYGVYDGIGGFIGIREKFGERYLDTELLGPAPGTVNVIEDLGPTGIHRDVQQQPRERLYEILDEAEADYGSRHAR